nr:MAG TPA: IrrE protein [Caudoviricetes sp.]
MLDLFKEGRGTAHLRGPVDPYQLAEALGVPVLYTRRLSGSLGVTDGKRIWLRRGMTSAVERSTLAHELAHILLGHKSCQDGRGEARADRLAVRLLVSLAEVERELRCCSSIESLAEALGVDMRMARTAVEILCHRSHK